jgi:protein kinase A
MRKKNDSSGSEQSVNRDEEKKYIAGAVRKEEPSRSSIGKASLVQRARAFDPKFSGNFDVRKFKTYNGELLRRSSWATTSRTDEEKEPAYLFVSPTLTDGRRKSMEASILFNMRNEEKLLIPRQSPQKSSYGIPKRSPVGPNMKALLDASYHRRISAVKPFQLPMMRIASKAIFVDDKPINKHAFKLKKVCAPKVDVNLETYKPPVNPKTEWQRSLLLKAIKNSFLLKNNHAKTEDALVDAMEKITVPRGGVVAKQGACSEEEDNFYVLQEGKVEFLVDDKRVKTAAAGESFGEERLLLRVPNETTIKAMEPSVLLKLNQTDFRTIMEKAITQEHETMQEEKSWMVQPSPKAPIFTAKASKHTAKHSVDKKKKKCPKKIELFDPSSLEKHSAEFKRQARIRSSIKKHASSKNDLEFIKILGEGQFGEVWLVAADLADIDPCCQQFALKIQNKNEEEIREDAVSEIQGEINVLKQLHHPFIVNLVHVYEDQESIDMLLGLIPGGELWDQIHIEDDNGIWTSGISEHRAKFISYVLADTFAFLHSRQFLFRDLKPENIMIDQDGYPVLVDFGFAKHVAEGSLTFTFCGTPNYIAPEVIRNTGQSVGVDHWALGVVIYEMISGENPFFYDDMGQVELYEVIASEEPFPIPDNKNASHQVKAIIANLLQKDPKERLGYNSHIELLQDPWFKGMPDLNHVRSKKIKAPADNDTDQALSFEDNDENSVASFVEEISEAEPLEDDEEVGVEGELPLSQVPVSPVKGIKEQTKWIVTPTSKGKLKGYYVSPKTPLERTTSKERRELLSKKMVDVIALDAETLGMIKPGARQDSNIGNYRPTK